MENNENMEKMSEEEWAKIDKEMDDAIERYERAKANGTLDEEFPRIL